MSASQPRHFDPVEVDRLVAQFQALLNRWLAAVLVHDTWWDLFEPWLQERMTGHPASSRVRKWRAVSDQLDRASQSGALDTSELAEVMVHPPFSYEELTALTQLALSVCPAGSEADQLLRQRQQLEAQILELCTPMIFKAARDIGNRVGIARTSDETPPLAGDAILGFYNALIHFQPESGRHFTNYLWDWVLTQAQTFLRREREKILTSRQQTELRKISDATFAFQGDHGRRPTDEELAALTGLSLDHVRNLLSLDGSLVRLDAALDADDDKSDLHSVISDPGSGAPWDDADLNTVRGPLMSRLMPHLAREPLVGFALPLEDLVPVTGVPRPFYLALEMRRLIGVENLVARLEGTSPQPLTFPPPDGTAARTDSDDPWLEDGEPDLP